MMKALLPLLFQPKHKQKPFFGAEELFLVYICANKRTARGEMNLCSSVYESFSHRTELRLLANSLSAK